MSNTRTFTFPISLLISSSKRLLGALRDPTLGPSVLARLKTKTPPAFDVGYEAQIKLVEKGGADQSGAVGAIGELTQAQAEAYTEMERLMSSARRTAALTFPGNDARLHSEFQIGNNGPQDLDSELGRAALILAACKTHADALSEHGWIEADTTLLEESITSLGGGDEEQEAQKDGKKGLTANRNHAANTLYKMGQSLQNAARLAYPSTQLGKTEGLEEARARYLLDEFPPRNSGGAAASSPTPSPAPVK